MYKSLDREISAVCVSLSELIEKWVKTSDNPGGGIAKGILIYIIFRFFNSRESLEELAEDLTQFCPLMVGESVNALLSSINFLIRFGQLAYKFCGSNDGCCANDSSFDCCTTEYDTAKLATDVIARIFKMISIGFVLNATVTSTFWGQEGTFFGVKGGSNALNFIAGAGAGIFASFFGISDSVVTICKQESQCKKSNKKIDKKQNECRKHYGFFIWKMFGLLVDDISAGLLIGGLSCIISGEATMDTGIDLMWGAGFGYGLSTIKDAVNTMIALYKVCCGGKKDKSKNGSINMKPIKKQGKSCWNKLYDFFCCKSFISAPPYDYGKTHYNDEDLEKTIQEFKEEQDPKKNEKKKISEKTSLLIEQDPKKKKKNIKKKKKNIKKKKKIEKKIDFKPKNFN
ncbi:MAG: hypothetical protein PVI75_06795 [Gammaproteobacteria bacterium]|jgi:hypothetical protein